MVKQIIAISGSGIGAGKTTLAKKLLAESWSLAGALRKSLKRIYPATDWYNKTQEFKSQRFTGDIRAIFPDADVSERLTNRDIMLRYGQMKCTNDDVHWARELVNDLEERLNIADGAHTIAVDDVRKVCEIEYLREAYGERLIHLHVDTDSATAEAEFDNASLRARADYLIKWER